MNLTITVVALVAILSINSCLAFSLLQPSRTVGTQPRRTVSCSIPTTLLQSSKEDEIAELEEKLRKLKEETEQETDGQPEKMASEEMEALESSVIEEPLEALLSESWKDAEASSEDQGSVVKNLIGAAILIVALIAFSQIPVGNEGLDKYSTAKPNQSIDLG
jgi:hypothetical protein